MRTSDSAEKTLMTLETDDEPSEAAKDPDSQVGEFVDSTTFHGFDQILHSNSILAKFFWILTVVLVFVVAILQLQSLVKLFMRNPTLTSINVIYPKEGLQMPSLTLCLLSKLNRTAVRSKYPNLNKTLAEFSTAAFFSAYSTSLMDFDYFREQGMSNEALEKALFSNFDGKNLSTFFQDVAFSCRNQFLYCWFENGKLTDCCKSKERQITVYRYLLHSGTCFELQAHDIRQRIPGPVGGFGFVYWYPNEHILQTAFNSYDEHALHLYLSPEDASLEKNPTVLPVGYHNHISLTAKYKTRLLTDAFGRSVCQVPKLKYFDEYSYGKCEVECLMDTLLQHCNCTGVSMFGRIPQDRLCTPMESLKCFEMMAEGFTAVLLECREKKCQEACHQWTYRASLTVGKTFHPMISKQLTSYWRLPKGRPSRSLILGDVYFDDIQYQDIKQQSAFTLESFVSSIGGAMGLWTGASVITWIHLLFFCLASLFVCEKKKKPLSQPLIDGKNRRQSEL